MTMTYRELYQWLSEELSFRENGRNEALWLIEAFSGKKYIDLNTDAAVGREADYKKAAALLKNHYPFQYVVGSQDFYGSKFAVNESVLVPRFETELLVDTAMKWGKGRELRVLDLCTGSGCIIISLARHLKGSFLGTDISEAALAVAKRNNEINGTAVDFCYSDLFCRLPKESSFDLITANPPYLTEEEMTEIPPELGFEPSLALDGGSLGLSVIERILREMKVRLNPDGLFLMEIGEGQGSAVLALAEKYQLNNGAIIKDWNHKDRIFRWQK